MAKVVVKNTGLGIKFNINSKKYYRLVKLDFRFRNIKKFASGIFLGAECFHHIPSEKEMGYDYEIQRVRYINVHGKDGKSGRHEFSKS
jgi:hypothetical protein